jgi:hypothetical protein
MVSEKRFNRKVLGKFQWLKPFLGFSGFAVSVPAAFLASLFEWLRRLSLRCLNG